jgi:hypothetical protein
MNAIIALMKIDFNHSISLFFLLYSLILSEPFEDAIEQDESFPVYPLEKITIDRDLII